MNVSFTESPIGSKKIRAYFSDGSVVDFGASGYDDYTIHKDEDRKLRYMKRHKKDLQTRDVMKPGYLSWFVLWSFPDLDRGIDYYTNYVLNSDFIITNPELYEQVDENDYEVEMSSYNIPAYIDL